MTDDPQEYAEEPDEDSAAPAGEADAQPEKGTYRSCKACGMFVSSDEQICPECGAYEDEDSPPVADRKYDLILSTVVVVILLLILAIMVKSPKQADQSGFNIPLLTEEDVPTPAPNPEPTPAVVVQQPTPRPPLPPTPTPKPVVVPPTPTPFNPVAIPTATPVPPPPPTPTPRRSKTLELKDQLMEEYRTVLDESHPFAQKGDFIRLNLTDGRNVSGTIVQMDNQQLLLETEVGRIILVFRQLTTESRIRVDMSERNARLEEKALQEVLRRLQDL